MKRKFISLDAIILAEGTPSLCQCPLRLAYSTVDPYIGKLHSIFYDFGCPGDWNRTLLLGDPAIDLLVNFRLRLPPSRPPTFSSTSSFYFHTSLKSVLSSHHLCQLRFLLLIEIKHSSRLFFSGDRGGDLG